MKKKIEMHIHYQMCDPEPWRTRTTGEVPKMIEHESEQWEIIITDVDIVEHEYKTFFGKVIPKVIVFGEARIETDYGDQLFNVTFTYEGRQDEDPKKMYDYIRELAREKYNKELAKRDKKNKLMHHLIEIKERG